MNVKELMSKVDVNRVIDAFLLMDFSFSASNYENTFLEKYEALPNLKKIMSIYLQNVNRIWIQIHVQYLFFII